MSENKEKKGLKLIIKEVEEKAKNSSVFSLGDFNALLAALMNEKEYSVNVVQGQDKDNGELKTKEVLPVKEFREFLVEFLKKATKMDKADAEAFVEKYDFTEGKVSSLYYIFTEAMDLYMRAGKSFSMPKKEDIIATLSYRDIEEKRNSGTMKVGDEERAYDTISKAHKKLVSSSGCPTWRKVKKM